MASSDYTGQAADKGQVDLTDDAFRGGNTMVWHPAIRAVGWMRQWSVWALAAAVCWECLDGGLNSASIQSIVTRTGLVCSLIVASIIPLEILTLRQQFGRWTRAEYDPAFAATLARVGSAAAIVASGVYAWLAWLTYRRWSGMFEALGHQAPEISFSRQVAPGWMAVLLVLAALVLTASLVFPIPSKHQRVWRVLGARRALRGYALMGLLRLRQPRPDFFYQAPAFRDIYFFAAAALLNQLIEPRFLAWTLSLLLVAVSLSITVDHLLCPVWLFLGRSHFDSFDTFDVLRARWPFGVTFLDRDSRAWHDYYFAAAADMARRGIQGARFMNRPRTPRVWSLRSRGDMWESSVQILMRIVPTIVIDVRVKSYWIFDEVLWLAELGWIEKAWLIGEPDGSCPGVDGALAWAKKDNVRLPEDARERLSQRVVTEDQLYAAHWDDTGLRIDPKDRTPISAASSTCD